MVMFLREPAQLDEFTREFCDFAPRVGIHISWKKTFFMELKKGAKKSFARRKRFVHPDAELNWLSASEPFEYLGVPIMLNIRKQTKRIISKMESTVRWMKFRIGFSGGLNRTIQSFYLVSITSYRVAALLTYLYDTDTRAYEEITVGIEKLSKKFLKSASCMPPEYLRFNSDLVQTEIKSAHIMRRALGCGAASQYSDSDLYNDLERELA